MTAEGNDVAFDKKGNVPARSHTFVIEIDSPDARGAVQYLEVQKLHFGANLDAVAKATPQPLCCHRLQVQLCNALENVSSRISLQNLSR